MALLVAALVLTSARGALAYRPFDGTDADTAELGSFELEMGPVQYYRQGPRNYLITPALVLNLGIFEATELVIDANPYVAVGTLAPGNARGSFLGDDILIKHTFRQGTLQGQRGPSIAAEGGLLTPEVNGINGEQGVSKVGASLDVITSYQWKYGAVHWNEWLELTRDVRADLFSGVILEGPHGWRVRPVAELYFDKDFVSGQTESVLVGAVWTLRESFVLDAAVRGARVGDEWAAEARLGFTWAIPVWTKAENAAGPPRPADR